MSLQYITMKQLQLMHFITTPLEILGLRVQALIFHEILIYGK